MIVKVQTYLPVAADRVWRALIRRETFRYITRGIFGYTGIDQWPEEFHAGAELKTRIVFFHLIPAWKHHLRIVRLNANICELASEEHGGFIWRWNHRITIEPDGEQRCRYTDEIDIQAGWLTIAVGAFAHLFYRYRQMRWRYLARSL